MLLGQLIQVLKYNYHLFHKKPGGFILKYYSEVTGIPFKRLLGENSATYDPLPHTSLHHLAK